MFVRIILAASALLAATLLADLPAAAEDCQQLGFEARVALLRRAPTCDRAMEQFANCNGGGSGDVDLGQIATEKCQTDFLTKLSAKQKRTYQAGIKHCNDAIKEDEGTLSRAIGAGCRANLAQSFAHKFGDKRSR